MAEDAVVHKVKCYVKKKSSVRVDCPKCGFLRTIDLIKMNLSKSTFNTNCRCGALLKVQLEFRTIDRKKVRFAGKYLHRKKMDQGDILIENLSLKGIRFSCMDQHNLQLDDDLEITFKLDNQKRTEITLLAKVIYVRGPSVGIERSDTALEQPDLGFYLMGG